MSRLSKLIAELCPNGVEYKKLGEIGGFYSGLSGKTKNDFKDGNAKFITYMNVYSNPSLKIDVDDKVKITEGERQNVIEYGDVLFTGSSETPDECGMAAVLTQEAKEPLYLNSFCFGYRLFDKKLFLPDFLKHLFRSSELRKQIRRTANGVTRFNVSKVKMLEVQIPLPPLAIQSEIVKILDNFAELTAELTAELEKRKKQYEHYRDMLLNFTGGGRYDNISQNEPCPSVEWKRLGEICEMKTGKLNANAQSENGKYPFFTCSDVPLRIDEYAFDCEALLIAGNGNIGETKHYIGKFNAYQRTYVLSSFAPNISVRYLYFYITAFIKPYVKARSKDGTLPYITLPILSGFEIPLPPLAEQERIVAILDRFDSLCNSLTEGLPAEIELRKKQSEYYRDKLLSFGRASSSRNSREASNSSSSSLEPLEH